MFQTAVWPQELWHPLTVHFPIALLFFATIIRLVALLLKNQRRYITETLASLLLIGGSLSAWLSIYTGDIADGAVARNLCDPTILKSHEIASYTMAYIFTSAALLYLISRCLGLNKQLALILRFSVILLMIVGCGYLVYGAHLGASLVYDQGAGVNKPGADCSGF